jgi:hypothetical protein
MTAAPDEAWESRREACVAKPSSYPTGNRNGFADKR